MSIITIASTKGGVGKSTLAVNLAVELLQQKQPVVLLDADPQGSVSKWNTVREMVISDGGNLDSIFVVSAQGQALLDLAVEKSGQGFFVLIDSAGVDNANTRTALLRTDYVLTLAAPSPLDLWEISPLLTVIEGLERTQKRKIPVLLVFNKVSPNPSVRSIEDAKSFLQDNMIFPKHIFETVIRDRIVFQHAIREGKSVAEYTPANLDARNELTTLTLELIQTIESLTNNGKEENS